MKSTIQKKYIYEMIKYHGPKKVDNVDIDKRLDFYKLEKYRRKLYIHHYGWSIPSQKSVKELAKFIGSKKVLEVGSGLGLWAYLLSLEGVNINATEAYVENINSPLFYDVEELDYKEALKKYNDIDILMLVWPPHDNMKGNELSDNILELFKGKYIIYIGWEVITGTKKLNNQLDLQWKNIKFIDIPRWKFLLDNSYTIYNVEDGIFIFSRI